MAINFDDYVAKLPREQQEAIRKRTAELIAEEAALRRSREARDRRRAEVTKEPHAEQE